MAEKKTILVTGANGQLGNEMRVISTSYTAFDFLFVTKEDLAIDDVESVNRYFASHTIMCEHARTTAIALCPHYAMLNLNIA